MYKGKPLLVFLAACASTTAVLLVVTASAAAATVTQTILPRTKASRSTAGTAVSHSPRRSPVRSG